MLFLTLKTFSATGGIEKVCRAAGKVFEEICGRTGRNFYMYSMYDPEDVSTEPYVSRRHFRTFGGKRMQFVIQSLLKGGKSDTVVLSHVNLALAGLLIKILSPRTKVILIAHGIEVWDRALSRTQKLFLQKADRIIAVSKFTKDQLTATYQLRNVQVVNDCLDPFLEAPVLTREEIRKRHSFSEMDFIILTVTRLAFTEVNKNYDHILISLSALKKCIPGLKYLFIGKYDIREKERLEAKAHELGLQDTLVFTGFVPDDEISSYYNACDLYVMPSKKEGFGLTFIEAAYYGLPVIAGNKDGSVDALLNGKLGVLIDPDDQEELTDAIREVHANVQSYKPDRNLVLENFGIEVNKRNWESVLNGL